MNYEISSMEKASIEAVLSRDDIIKKWEEPHCKDLPELINSIKNVKQSINSYLTELIENERGIERSSKGEENVEDEEEADVEDSISGFIKEAVLGEEVQTSNKRKVHCSNKTRNAKKKK